MIKVSKMTSETAQALYMVSDWDKKWWRDFLRLDQKTSSKGTQVMCWDKLFQIRAVATGKAWKGVILTILPIVLNLLISAIYHKPSDNVQYTALVHSKKILTKCSIVHLSMCSIVNVPTALTYNLSIQEICLYNKAANTPHYCLVCVWSAVD